MHKLLIADRDTQELVGLEWLISKYSFPLSHSMTASQFVEVIGVMEKELPDVLCIELDMIPEDKWEMFKTYRDRYVGEVLAITAEPTFERAMQAIEIGAVDLMVKPLSPSSVKTSLQKAFRHVALQSREATDISSYQTVWYESLFIDENIAFQFPVYLMKTESTADLKELRFFIEQFDFYYKPLVFSTSDRIALVFQDNFPEPVSQAQRFLREWEGDVGKPLVVAVHNGEGEASLHQIYMKLRKVMETTFFTGYQQVLSFANESDWQDIDPFLTMTEQRNWVYMLDEGCIDEIKTWMYEQFFGLVSPYPDPGLLRTRLTSILAQIRRYMIRKGMTDAKHEAKYKKVFDTILYSPVLYRIVQDMILFVTDLLQSISKHPVTTKIDVIEEALSYIEDHYGDAGLSLEEVASHVHRNPSYLSYTLSHKYGRSFREVLTYIRIQKAKEMLISSKETVQWISHESGFN
ncbi:MAG: helix-turn-helix domain-containing protein, partial [Anaerobacillus sp.]